jgi:hypothetical protein
MKPSPMSAINDELTIHLLLKWSLSLFLLLIIPILELLADLLQQVHLIHLLSKLIMQAGD